MTTGKSTKKIVTPNKKQVVFVIEHRVLFDEISDVVSSLESLNAYDGDAKIVDVRVEETKDA